MVKRRGNKQVARSRHPRVIGFSARLYALRPEEGGRKTPFRNGYRPQCHFTADQPGDNDVSIQMVGQEWCAPGEECTAQLTFFVPDAVMVMIVSGADFVLREGTRVVIRGTVIEVAYSLETP